MMAENNEVHQTNVLLRWKFCDESLARSTSLAIEWTKKEINQRLNRLYLEIHNLKNTTISECAVLDCDVASHEISIDVRSEPENNEVHTCYLIVIYGLTNLDSKQMFCFHVVGSVRCTLDIDKHKIKEEEKCITLTLLKDLTYQPVTANLKKSFHISMLHFPPSAYGISADNGCKSVITIIRRHLPVQTLLFLQMIADDLNMDVLFDLRPATDYTIWMFSVEEHEPDGGLYKRSGFSTIEVFRTYLTIKELKLLCYKAVTSMKRLEFAYLEYFYRNKPVKYYQDIFENHQGIMKPYVKDDNGDCSSIINRNIEGLFFNAYLDRKLNPAHSSYFGKRRAFIRSEYLFHGNSNLYFADFYCHYEKHYVTLVLTEKHSRADNFCVDRLHRLNNYDNPFLKLINVLGIPKVYTTLGIHVEVLYTEPINLNIIQEKQSGFLFKDVPVLGRGSSKPSGIPKNSNCKICNL